MSGQAILPPLLRSPAAREQLKRVVETLTGGTVSFMDIPGEGIVVRWYENRIPTFRGTPSTENYLDIVREADGDETIINPS